MPYTTVTNVRRDAGFTGNTNVTDAQISNIITLVEGEIDSSLSDVYTLNLPVFYQNTITFSGTGSGTATMTITIDGDNFTVAVTSGLTATAAADLFRISAAANTGKDFTIIDDLGHGAIVTIVSANQSQERLDVTVTSTDPQTVSGIVATGGTVTGLAVKIVESISTGMAAARLLIQEYGPEAQGTDKDGFKRMALFQDILDKIQSKKMKLLDFTGTELPRSSSQRLAFYPTETSRTADSDPTANKITMNSQF